MKAAGQFSRMNCTNMVFLKAEIGCATSASLNSELRNATWPLGRAAWEMKNGTKVNFLLFYKLSIQEKSLSM